MGAHSVLANGGVNAQVGMHLVALAAKRHSIPFVVLVGLHKLSPLFPHNPDLAFNGGWVGPGHQQWVGWVQVFSAGWVGPGLMPWGVGWVQVFSDGWVGPGLIPWGVGWVCVACCPLDP